MGRSGGGERSRPQPDGEGDGAPGSGLVRRAGVRRRLGRISRERRSPRPGPWLRPRGFTLVEMMVAVLLIGVGLMGLAALSTTVTRANVQSSTLTAASSLAQERIEQFRAVPYESIADGSDVRTVDGVAYTRAWAVTTDDPAVGLKTVTVTVTWSTRGATHRTALSTIRGSR